MERADFSLIPDVEDMPKSLLREYTVVGDMPEVVASHVADGDLVEAVRLQCSILADYEADFSKRSPARILERMRLV